MKLYKFKSLEDKEKKKHVKEIIEGEKLYCADYCKLNDPFEGLLLKLLNKVLFL